MCNTGKSVFQNICDIAPNRKQCHFRRYDLINVWSRKQSDFLSEYVWLVCRHVVRSWSSKKACLLIINHLLLLGLILPFFYILSLFELIFGWSHSRFWLYFILRRKKKFAIFWLISNIVKYNKSTEQRYFTRKGEPRLYIVQRGFRAWALKSSFPHEYLMMSQKYSLCFLWDSASISALN